MSNEREACARCDHVAEIHDKLDADHPFEGKTMSADSWLPTGNAAVPSWVKGRGYIEDDQAGGYRWAVYAADVNTAEGDETPVADGLAPTLAEAQAAADSAVEILPLHESLNQAYVTACCHCGFDRNLEVDADSRVYCFACEARNAPIVSIESLTGGKA